MKICPTCKQEHNKNIYCSRSCANSASNKKRKHREETKKRIALSVCKTMGIEYKEKSKPKPNHMMVAIKRNIPFTKVNKCTYCKKWYNHSARPNSTCSDECFIKVKTVLNAGVNSHHYKNIRFDSGWEVKIAKYMDKQNIKWIRPKNSLLWIDESGKERKYFPDFYLPDYDLYLDPKNPIAENKQNEKVLYLKKNYSNIIIGSLQEILAHLEGLEPTCNPVNLSTRS